jgi:hypothetical protein
VTGSASTAGQQARGAPGEASGGDDANLAGGARVGLAVRLGRVGQHVPPADDDLRVQRQRASFSTSSCSGQVLVTQEPSMRSCW